MPGCAAVSWVASVRYGVATNPEAPVWRSENAAVCAVVAVLSTTTETEPSRLRNAVTSRFPLALEAPILIAPGRTNRLKFANAHRRPDVATVLPWISTSPSLSPFSDGVVEPHQYRNAFRSDAVSPV